MVYERLRDIRSWLWPGSCLLCHSRLPWGQDLCADCTGWLPRIANPCPMCAAALPADGPDGLLCGRCLQTPRAFDRTRAIFAYAPPVNRLIQDLKYHRRLDLARVLGGYLAEGLAAQAPQRPELLIPVPLHRSRLRERGYNQALELARPVAKRLNLALEVTAVERVRSTPPQTALSYGERKKNMRNAFRARCRFDDRCIAIVDDVMTSGHTVEELARCLKRAGAKEVEVWVIARA